jgi:hypothetical protein
VKQANQVQIMSNSQLSPITNGLLSLNLSQPGTHSSSDENTILVVKFDYVAKEPHELDIKKGERLVLIDNSKNWWLVRKLDSDQTGYKQFYVKKLKICIILTS